MPEVSPVRTPYTAAQLQAALSDAWSSRFGETVRADVLALLMALVDLETNFKSSYHHNLGNIVLPAQYLPTTEQGWFVLSGDEGAAAGAGDAEHHYKVYASHAAGALALVTQLTRATRQEWWDGLLSGKPERFVKALNGQFGGPSYFEANFKRYLKAFRGRWRKYGDLKGPKASPLRRGNQLTVSLTLLGLAVLLLRSRAPSRRLRRAAQA